MSRNVAIIGASDKQDRYAYRAFKLLASHGYNPIPINPRLDSIEGKKCYKSLDEVDDHIHTITIYVNPSISSTMIDSIVAAKPHRVIMNPGTENSKLGRECSKNGIEVVYACTLVMLTTGQF